MMLKNKNIVVFLSIMLLVAFAAYCPSPSMASTNGKAKKEVIVPGSMAEKYPRINAFTDPDKLSDMSDFDPANPIIPTGDTIKIGLVQAYSGHSAQGGEVTYAYAYWAVHDINKRGGIWVDGKKKLIALIKADNQSNPEQCRKVIERLVLQEKVHVLWGANGSIMTKIMNDAAKKHKIIAHSSQSWGDHLMDAENFNRYTFHSMVSTEQLGRGMAYYYGQVRKKEKKFYILCQDYSFGRSMTDGFKKGLKEYFPEAQIVGEDYHKLFLMDFAPYLEKIKASGAEVIYTADWRPDSETLLLQARQMGIKIPFAHFYIDEPNTLEKVGVEGTKGLIQLSQYGLPGGTFKTPAQINYYTAWNNLWKTKWKAPYNAASYKHLASTYGVWTEEMYWLLSVIERAKSTDPEKIIKVWENDTYRYANGKILRMRACDHKAIQDLAVFEFVPPDQQKVSYNMPPYTWYDKASFWGPAYFLPAATILPWMDQKLDRCTGKNDWGE